MLLGGKTLKCTSIERSIEKRMRSWICCFYTKMHRMLFVWLCVCVCVCAILRDEKFAKAFEGEWESDMRVRRSSRASSRPQIAQVVGLGLTMRVCRGRKGWPSLVRESRRIYSFTRKERHPGCLYSSVVSSRSRVVPGARALRRTALNNVFVGFLPLLFPLSLLPQVLPPGVDSHVTSHTLFLLFFSFFTLCLLSLSSFRCKSFPEAYRA